MARAKQSYRNLRVRLSTDRMTDKQWKEMCGSVKTYHMTSPISWEEFKSMPADVQAEYIKGLQERFGANATSFAQMFGVRPLTVRRLIAANKVQVNFPVGKSMTKEQKGLWNSFIDVETERECEVVSEDSCEDADWQSDIPTVPYVPAPKMEMNGVRFSFSGPIDISGIANSLRTVIGENRTGRIEIICELT